MGSMDKKFTWVLKKFSSLQEEKCYSRSFTVAGRTWRLLAYPKGKENNNYLGVYLELADPASLPSGWSRDVKFSLSVITKGWRKSNIVLGDQCCFSERSSSWGYDEFVCLNKLHAKREGFLMDDRLVIIAKLQVLPAAVVPEGSVKIIEHLRSKKGDSSSQVETKTENVSKEGSVGDDDTSDDYNTSKDDEDASWEEVVDDVSVGKSSGNSSDQVEQKTKTASEENLDDEDESKEGSEDDDDTSDKGTDDNGSWEEVVNNDVSFGKSPGNSSDQVEQKSKTASEEDLNDEEGSDDDDTSDDDGLWEKVVVSDDASSPVSDDGGRNQWNVLEDAYHSGGDLGGRAAEAEVFNSDNDDGTKEDVDDDSSHATDDGTEAAKDIQSAQETLDVNGFKVLTSQVESVSHVFKRHPDIALGFRPKNQHIRRIYMNELLSLIEMLCKSTEKLSEDDLSNADETLDDLIDAGFKLDWLKTKLTEVSEKKKKEQASVVRVQTMEEQLQKLKLMFLDLETQLQKEKVETLAARAPLSFHDVVC